MKLVLDITASRRSDVRFFPLFQKSARGILRALGFKSAAFSVILVRDRRMAALNQKLLRHEGTTDVLSFSYLEKKGKVKLVPKLLSANPPAFLGEVIICLDTAKRNAKEYKTGFEYECALYLCHGILHCLGYDDTTQKGFNEMKKLQEKILKSIFRTRGSGLGARG
jgi:probable rRNA maturation factor